MFEKVYLNKYGFYELKNKPSNIDLEKYYKNTYYQQAKGTYEINYTQEELTYIKNKLEQKYKVIKEILINTKDGLEFLDIGCGEGWSLNFFKGKNWKITGIDFSIHGCNRFNPQVIENLIEGDLYVNIDKLIEKRKKFDCIYLLNVLEHVLDPLILLNKCYELLSHNGVILVEVPNDFSRLQQYLINNNMIDKPFWVCVPDHISYFNMEGLINICNESRFSIKKVMSDFPIDFNLFNNNTNYVIDKSKGKSCYKAKVNIENFLHSISDSKVNKVYEALAQLGLGRNIMAFIVKNSIK